MSEHCRQKTHCQSSTQSITSRRYEHAEGGRKHDAQVIDGEGYANPVGKSTSYVSARVL
jgi:hypothetical protein